MPEPDVSSVEVREEAAVSSLSSTVGALCGAIRDRLDPGAVSELRRMTPGAPGGPAYWGLVHGYLEPRGALPMGPARERAEEAWAEILRALAVLRGLHAPSEALGKVLGANGFADMRLQRLLRASGERLANELRSATHFLAQKGLRVNCTQIARLVLTDDIGRGEAREKVRRTLARDYYRVATRSW
jgi:CRISPR system Cascade subunit CasB